jgi:hypothetical protein
LGVVVILSGVFQQCSNPCVAQSGALLKQCICDNPLQWPLIAMGTAIVLLSALGLAFSMRKAKA